MSMSLHESIIEEEEFDDAEVCDSIVYVVDGGEPNQMKGRDEVSSLDDQLCGDLDNISGSGYSSDVTVINANLSDHLDTDQDSESSQLPKHTKFSNTKKEKVGERQTNKHKDKLPNHHLGVQDIEKASISRVNENDFQNALEQSDIKIVPLEQRPYKERSRNKSGLSRGKIFQIGFLI